MSENVKGTFTALSLHLQLENESAVLTYILEKLFTHLQEANPTTYKISLEIFSDIIDGTRICKIPGQDVEFLVCGNLGFSDDNALAILGNYSQGSFKFMDPLIVDKYRKEFMKSITRLFFMMGSKISINFDVLLTPITLCVDNGVLTNNISMLQNALYDLTGVLMGCMNNDHFYNFFMWLYPSISQSLSTTVCSYWDKREISIPFLTFLKEIALNRT